MSTNSLPCCNSSQCFSNLYPPAAAKVGSANRNENSVASARVNRPCKPPAIVAAERLTPGIIAKHWNSPIFIASTNFRSEIFLSPGGKIFSIYNNTIPKITNVSPGIQGAFNIISKRSSNKNPKMAAGIKPMIKIG